MITGTPSSVQGYLRSLERGWGINRERSRLCILGTLLTIPSEILIIRLTGDVFAMWVFVVAFWAVWGYALLRTPDEFPQDEQLLAEEIGRQDNDVKHPEI